MKKLIAAAAMTVGLTLTRGGLFNEASAQLVACKADCWKKFRDCRKTHKQTNEACRKAKRACVWACATADAKTKEPPPKEHVVEVNPGGGSKGPILVESMNPGGPKVTPVVPPPVGPIIIPVVVEVKPVVGTGAVKPAAPKAP